MELFEYYVEQVGQLVDSLEVNLLRVYSRQVSVGNRKDG